MNTDPGSKVPPATAGGTVYRILLAVCVAGSLGAVLLLAALCVNHVSMPLHLDLMEGTILQHLQRAADGQVVYPAPSSDFVPLAYNVLYYYLCLPLAWVRGVDLVTMRSVSVLAMIGIELVLFAAVRERTGSSAWGLIAAGLFAAAYGTMDAYLDTAHTDAWMLFMAILGSWVVGRSRSRAGSLLGVGFLVLAFWCKQHGALLTVGGVLYLTRRDGLRAAWPCWALAGIGGPLLWLVAGPALFGSHYLYFTWEVPRRWSTFNIAAATRVLEFFLRYYPLLVAASAWLMVRGLLRGRDKLDVWAVQLVFAALSAFLGALDYGSSNNVFVGLGIYLILAGTIALHDLTRTRLFAPRPALVLVAVLISVAAHKYDPRRFWVPSSAEASYTDLLEVLRGLDGPVDGPTLGYLGDDFELYPRAHWVGLEDMIRGPGRELEGQPIVAEVLAPALDHEGPAYVMAHKPLDGWFTWLGLDDSYRLVTDYGDRFRPIAPLPKRWDHGWPRYLYVHVGAASEQGDGKR